MELYCISETRFQLSCELLLIDIHCLLFSDTRWDWWWVSETNTSVGLLACRAECTCQTACIVNSPCTKLQQEITTTVYSFVLWGLMYICEGWAENVFWFSEGMRYLLFRGRKKDTLMPRTHVSLTLTCRFIMSVFLEVPAWHIISCFPSSTSLSLWMWSYERRKWRQHSTHIGLPISREGKVSNRSCGLLGKQVLWFTSCFETVFWPGLACSMLHNTLINHCSFSCFFSLYVRVNDSSETDRQFLWLSPRDSEDVWEEIWELWCNPCRNHTVSSNMSRIGFLAS